MWQLLLTAEEVYRVYRRSDCFLRDGKALLLVLLHGGGVGGKSCGRRGAK